MELGEPDDSGRRRPVPVEGSEFDFDADLIVYAIGTNANPIMGQTSGLRLNKWGYIDTDESLATSLAGVFAGGDIVTGAATVISVPIGIMTAIYLVEYGKGRLAKSITFLVDVMTGIPSIVAGLFAFALFALIFGPGIRFGIGGAVALSLLMIPGVVRSTEEMLKLVPNELREAAYALGVPKWLTIVKVVVPTAIAGIITGVMISIARIIGETAPLLIIAGLSTSVNYDLFSERMTTLPVFVYTQYTIQGADAQAYIDRAWAGALVLIIIVLLLNLIARILARVLAPKGSR
jgi:phosphate transport system permease protein